MTVVGVNHQTSDVAIREALAPRPDELGRLNESFRSAASLEEGAVVLATCSRFEVYSSLDDAGLERLRAVFERRAGRPLGASLYVQRGPQAISHLFRVSAGLDSWVIGETEILGQVKAAYHQACEERTATRALHLAFQRALFVGKKVRNQTSIVGGIASIGGAAAILARRIFNKLEDQRIIVFGAGAMAASTVRHLRSKGIGQLWVANRSAERARQLASELGGEAVSLDEGLRLLEQAEVAVFSTACDTCLLDEARARAIARRRAGRSVFVIDLGLPRNVDPGVGRVEGVFVYDMDDLRRLVNDSLKRRESDLACANEIVSAESADCWSRIAAPAAVSGMTGCPLRKTVPSALRTKAA